MAIVSSKTVQKSYDVIIVGSGAGGGQSAYTLTLEGVKVLLLEAGINYDPAQAPMFQTPNQSPLRAAPTPDKQEGFYDATINGGWTIPGEPYTSASQEQDRRVIWWRARMLGGRTNHWNRIALRNGPYDFKPKQRDGLGFDWPISYEDLEPYYNKAEMLMGVCGSHHGVENAPDSPPGCLLPPPKARVGELLVRQRAGRLGIPVIPCNRAVLTERLDHSRLPAKLHPGNLFAQKIVRDSMASRAACFWATECYRGCSIRANYQSPTVHLPPAMATGNLDILCNAVVREVTLGKDGKATGVLFIDKITDREEHVQGRVVVLAAGAWESVRILLNSRSTQFPQGLANSSGTVGKYITDSAGTTLYAQIPLLESLPPHNEDGAGGPHLYVPWWLNREQHAGKLDFTRGYHIEFFGGRRMPNITTMAGLEQLTEGSYGRRFKEDARRYYGSFMGFWGGGAMIPNKDCFCELDPEARDRWGIPVLRFHWKWSEHETRLTGHMQKTFTDIVSAMDGRTLSDVKVDGAKAIRNGGSGDHQVGGAIMGDDPASSVTNEWNQTHDVKNLFIVDGAVFASHSEKNPTLTIIALAWRAADHIVTELKSGNL
jgi:choline dehydrogenase-like flavoprotein